jgi:hypothetical protein
VLSGVDNVTRNQRRGSDWGSSGADIGGCSGHYNSGDGTNNINNQGELLSSPSSINIRNKYFTEIIIQKIA